jgi:uncharacterized iron-regulated membrane protein
MKKVIGTIHLWIGFTLCLPLVALGLTGSWLTYAEDVEEWFATPPVLAHGPQMSATEILSAARAAVPSGHVASLYAPPGEDGLATVRFSRSSPGGGPRFASVKVDPVSLATYQDTPRGSWLRDLHTSFFMQDIAGRSVAGWLGVAMLALGISGIVNWWPRKPIRFTLNLRSYLHNHDIHGAVGIWGLVVFLVVSFSGVALCFPRTIHSAVDAVVPVRDTRAIVAAVKVEPVPNIERMSIEDTIALAQGAYPAARVAMVSLPQRPTQPVRVTLLRPGEELGTPVPSVFIDPYARRIVERLDPQDFTAAEAALAWQHGLHEARGLGPVWKFLVFLSGFLPLIFTVTGLRIWWLKRRAQLRQGAVKYAIETELQ